MPTALWIDEDRRITRPNDVVFGSNTFKFLTGIDSEEHIEALKKWVKSESDVEEFTYDPAEQSQYRSTPSREQQKARCHYHLAQWLYENDRSDSAQKHFEHACELAPDDVAIRRGSMRMRDANPLGWGFITMYFERLWNGLNYYNPLPD